MTQKACARAVRSGCRGLGCPWLGRGNRLHHRGAQAGSLIQVRVGLYPGAAFQCLSQRCLQQHAIAGLHMGGPGGRVAQLSRRRGERLGVGRNEAGIFALAQQDAGVGSFHGQHVAHGFAAQQGARVVEAAQVTGHGALEFHIGMAAVIEGGGQAGFAHLVAQVIGLTIGILAGGLLHGFGGQHPFGNPVRLRGGASGQQGGGQQGGQCGQGSRSVSGLAGRHGRGAAGVDGGCVAAGGEAGHGKAPVRASSCRCAVVSDCCRAVMRDVGRGVQWAGAVRQRRVAAWGEAS